MKTITSVLCASVVTLCSVVSSFAAMAKTGEPAPAFTLTDINGQTHSLSDYKGKTVVLEWVNPECPFVRKHYESGNMPALQKEAEADGVVWISINSAAPGKQGDFAPAEVKSWMGRVGAAPTVYARDPKGELGHLYGAKTTPHMFVITPAGELVYDGAIDSIRSADKSDIAKAQNYVKTALADVKAGQPVAKANTQPYGCSVKY